MKKVSMVFAAVLISTALTATAFAFGPGGGWGRGHGGRPCYNQGDGPIPAASQLNLTAEQTEKIKVLRETHLKNVTPLRDKMFSKRAELKLLWLQTSPDQNKIMSVQKEIRALRDQLEDKRTSHRLDVFNLLTPEQRTKFQAYGGHRGRGMGGPCIGGPGGPGGPGGGPGFGPGPGPRGNR
jgi:Spy/CpxP family protein refolding chaperone